MKAVVQARYGSPDDLEVREVDAPPVGEDEVLVRVRAVALHPDVWHVVTGRPWILRLMGAGPTRPRNPIPGRDVAGVVESVGARVTRFRPGDPVFGLTTDAHEWIHGGALAESVAVREDLLALKPGTVSFEQAASVPTSGHIALTNLRGGTLVRPGMSVLVNGAGGGVGSLALQIAKGHGARVTGVDVAGKLEMLRTLGADEVLDHEREDFTRHGVRHDLIVDVPGNHSLPAIRRVLAADGKYVLIGHEGYGSSGSRALGLLPRFLGLFVLSLFVESLRLGRVPIPDRREAVATLARLLEDGTITPVVDSVWPLGKIHEAFRRMVRGEPRGKVVVAPGDPAGGA